MINTKSRKITLFIIMLFILLVIGLLVSKITSAYFAPTLSEDVVKKGEVTASGDKLIFTSGDKLSLSATTDNFKTGGSNLTSTTNPKVTLIASSKTNNAEATYYVGFNITSNTYNYSTSNTPEVLLTIKDNTGNNITSVSGLTYTTSGEVSGFDITNKTGFFDVAIDKAISTTSSTSGTTHTWTFTLTFINLSTDQSINENANLDMEVYLNSKKPTYADFCDETTLACHIAKKYTGVQGENGLYYHDSSLTNGAGDNSYRYAGASDQVNNYVCFGSTESTCPTDNLYRIIGVFGDQVKLIKADYANSNLLGTDGDYNTEIFTKSSYSTYKGSLDTVNRYYWNYKQNTSINLGSGSNTWSTSLLNKTNLNINFINNIGSEWASKIAQTTWKVGGNTYSNEYQIPLVAYQNEIVNPYSNTIYDAKIGLMYVSDYGFAASPEAWMLSMDSYSDSTVTSSNWLYLGIYEWTISYYAIGSSSVFYVSSSGDVGNSGAGYSSAVRPVFYLESSATYSSGFGASSDPIRIN